MVTSNLIPKPPTTVPQPVRAAIGPEPCDAIADDPFATFAEWNSEADAAASDNL